MELSTEEKREKKKEKRRKSQMSIRESIKKEERQINKRNELDSKCRHEREHILANIVGVG